MKVKKSSFYAMPIFVVLLMNIYFESLIDSSIRLGITMVGIITVFLYCGFIRKKYRMLDGTNVWMLALLIFAISVKGYPGTVSYAVILVFGISLLFIGEVSIRGALSLISIATFMGKFFSIFTLIQFLLPSVYRIVVFPLLSQNSSQVTPGASSILYMNGLTKNVALNAIYILFGLSCIIIGKYRRFSMKDYVWIIIELLCILLTGKRVAVIFGGLAVIAALNTGENFGKKFNNIAIYTIVALFIIIVCIIFIPQVRNLFVRIFDFSGDFDSYSSKRGTLYLVAIRYFKQKPILGNGWFYYRNTIQRYWGSQIDAHNIYLQLLCETGAVGTVIFVGAIVRPVLYSLSKVKRIVEPELRSVMKICICMQIFFILYGITGNPLYDGYCLSMFFLVTLISHFETERYVEEE